MDFTPKINQQNDEDRSSILSEKVFVLAQMFFFFFFLFNSRSLLFWEGPASLVRAIQISSTQKHWNDIT